MGKEFEKKSASGGIQAAAAAIRSRT